MRGNGVMVYLLGSVFAVTSVGGAVTGFAEGDVAAALGWVALAAVLPIAFFLVSRFRYRDLWNRAEYAAGVGQVLLIFTAGRLVGEKTGVDLDFGAGWVELSTDFVRVRTVDGRVDESFERGPQLIARRAHLLSSWVSVPALSIDIAGCRELDLEIVNRGWQSLVGPSNSYVDTVAARIG